MTEPPRPRAPLLSVYDLSLELQGPRGRVPVLDRVSFDLPHGKILAVLGESGAGKTSLALAIPRLFPPGRAYITSGAVLFEHQDLVRAEAKTLERVRGRRIGFAFQHPLGALEPDRTLGQQLVDTLRLHEPLSRSEARSKALALLEEVGMPEPERRLDEHPHTLSGGLLTRAMLAIALAGSPSLLIADEPTASLDIIAQAQILRLLRTLCEERGMSVLLIVNNPEVVAEVADQVLVLYAGQLVELGPVAEVLRSPAHPYTLALLRSVPPRRSPQRSPGEPLRKLPTLSGRAPALDEPLPPGCRFASRCPERQAECEAQPPALVEEGRRQVRCLLTDDLLYAREQSAPRAESSTAGEREPQP